MSPRRKPPRRVLSIRGDFAPDVVTQAQLQEAADLQATAWLAEKQARECVQGLERRIMHGAAVEPGEMTFDRDLQMARRRKDGTGT